MAAVWLNKEDAVTLDYLSNLDRMHKIIVAAESEQAVRDTALALDTAGIPHKLWIEQPEGIATCLATKPCKRKDTQDFFKAFKLLR